MRNRVWKTELRGGSRLEVVLGRQTEQDLADRFIVQDPPLSLLRDRVDVAQPALERIGTHSCGDPAWVLADWLRHATARHGRLGAGTVVSTGTWAGAPPALPGDRVVLDFDGIGQAVTHF